MHEQPDRTGERATFEEHLRFEQMISKVSSMFIDLPAAEIDRNIEEGLRLVAEAMGCDLAAFIEYEPERDRFRFSHAWAADHASNTRPDLGHTFSESSGTYPWLARQLVREEPMMFDRLEGLPPEAGPMRERLEAIGMKSVMWAPFAVEGQLLGHVAMGTVVHQATWSDRLARRVRVVGEIFANAIVRQRTEQSMREHRRGRCVCS